MGLDDIDDSDEEQVCFEGSHNAAEKSDITVANNFESTVESPPKCHSSKSASSISESDNKVGASESNTNNSTVSKIEGPSVSDSKVDSNNLDHHDRIAAKIAADVVSGPKSACGGLSAAEREKNEEAAKKMAAAAGLQLPQAPDAEMVVNSAQDELMRLMQWRKKKKDEEEKNKKKEESQVTDKQLIKEGGLFKKGFLGGGGSKKKSSSSVTSNTLTKDKNVDIDLTKKHADINTAGKKDMPNLALPEVQEAMRNTVKNEKSWLTPDLAKAFSQRPDLMMGMRAPKIQEAMKLMQSNPKLAQEKYADDEEVTKFFKEFTAMMGTHFSLLAEKAEKEAKQDLLNKPEEVKNAVKAAGTAISAAQMKDAQNLLEQTKKANSGSNLVPVLEPVSDVLNQKSKSNLNGPKSKNKKSSKTVTSAASVQTGFDAAAKNLGLSADEKERFQDPKVIEAMSDPKVQYCIGMLKQGKEMNMRQIGREDFPTFQKLQYLISRGILGIST